jgi:phosphoribosylformylglycinamidine synthase
MLGLIEDLKHITTSYFKEESDLIYVLGEDFEEIGGSEYLKVIHNLATGDSPKIDLKKEKDIQDLLLNLIKKGLIKSAHDVSEGGIISCLAECCIIQQEKSIGAKVNIPVKTREDFSFFSESQSRIIISISAGNKNQFEKIAASSKCSFTYLGVVTGNKLDVNGNYKFDLARLSDIYFNTISRIMGG